MDLLIVFVIASVIGAVMIAWVIIWTANRASASAITRHFKASEYILETGKPPPDWLAAPIWRRLRAKADTSNSEISLLARLDELIRFFEHCSFYEDEFAREQHLSQLEGIRRAWQSGEVR
ncbi:MAG: hypothetical protein OXI77_12305 [Chloroflexota bacterium]|nr:hypothetical protein [Chloroflexota bacterium]MDE2909192.1 hypothetical protein [Chloroflexota bacterium]